MATVRARSNNTGSSTVVINAAEDSVQLREPTALALQIAEHHALAETHAHTRLTELFGHVESLSDPQACDKAETALLAFGQSHFDFPVKAIFKRDTQTLRSVIERIIDEDCLDEKLRLGDIAYAKAARAAKVIPSKETRRKRLVAEAQSNDVALQSDNVSAEYDNDEVESCCDDESQESGSDVEVDDIYDFVELPATQTVDMNDVVRLVQPSLSHEFMRLDFLDDVIPEITADMEVSGPNELHTVALEIRTNLAKKLGLANGDQDLQPRFVPFDDKFPVSTTRRDKEAVVKLIQNTTTNCDDAERELWRQRLQQVLGIVDASGITWSNFGKLTARSGLGSLLTMTQVVQLLCGFTQEAAEKALAARTGTSSSRVRGEKVKRRNLADAAEKRLK